jgi:hypothetical protein
LPEEAKISMISFIKPEGSPILDFRKVNIVSFKGQEVFYDRTYPFP